MATGYSASQRTAAIVTGIVNKYLPTIIRQVERDDYPLWDELMKRAKKSNVRTTYAKVTFDDPTSTRIAAIGSELTRGISTVAADSDISVTKRYINSPLKILKEDLIGLGDYHDLKEWVVNYVQRSFRGHFRMLRRYIIYDDVAKPGLLFKLKDAAATYTAGSVIKIDTTAGVPREVAVTQPVDFHAPGNSTATLAGTVITYYDPNAAGGPVVKLNDAITIPAGGILEAYAQGSYAIGLADPLCKLVDPNQATYMGLTHPGWVPTVHDAGDNALTDDMLVDLAIELTDKGCRQPVAFLDGVQHKQLVTVLKNSRYLNTQGPNLIGGFGGITIHLGENKPKLIVVRDTDWPHQTRVPIFDLKDLTLEYLGDKLAYMPDYGGGEKIGGGVFMFDTSTSNRLVGDIDSWPCIYAQHRAWHGCVDNVDDTP